MLRTYILLAACIAVVALTGCSTTYKPAPIGDKIVWTTHEDGRPAWSVEAPEHDEDDAFVEFVGQSLYHSTERGARSSAEADAAARAALYLTREAQSTYRESSSGADLEDEIQNPNVVISNTTEVTAKEALSRMTIEEWYLENWSKNQKSLWKAFVRVRIPKDHPSSTEIKEQQERQAQADRRERERMKIVAEKERRQEVRDREERQAQEIRDLLEMKQDQELQKQKLEAEQRRESEMNQMRKDLLSNHKEPAVDPKPEKG